MELVSYRGNQVKERNMRNENCMYKFLFEYLKQGENA
jgi:hypothetical protein